VDILREVDTAIKDDSVSLHQNVRKMYSHKLLINRKRDMTVEISTAIVDSDLPIRIDSTTKDVPVLEEIGRSKRRHTLKQIVLDGCLCGVVADPASDGVLKCKQVGCETQWVSIFILLHCQCR
jgi:hypothetical protein